MKKLTFYNRTSILLFSFLLTGIVGVLMMGYNLWKAGKRNIVIPMMLIIIVVYTMIGSGLKAHRNQQWSLNKAVGWDKDITNFSSWIVISYQFFLTNLVIGLLLIFPVWNIELSYFPKQETKKPWIPLIIALILYGSLLVTLFAE